MNAVALSAGHAGRRFRPRPRWRELGLLVVAGSALACGSLALGLTTGRSGLADGRALALYLGLLGAAHVALVLAGRRVDEILLPVVGLLGGIGLLLMERLPQDLVTQSFGAFELGLASLQLLWLGVAISVAVAVAVFFRSDRILRLYRYSWAAVGIGLLALTFVLGRDVNGARLTLEVGPVSGQPSELLKVILVVFLAGYLADNRDLLAGSLRLGPLRLPPLPYLAPMLVMVALALLIVVVQRDLGAALLVYGVFLLLLYAATSRLGYVILGTVLFIAGGAVLVTLFGHVRTRIEIWIDPFADPQGAGYQLVQALYAVARGGIFGTGLGGGLPTVGGRLPIPAIQTDFPFAALGEELGLAGILAIIGLYLVVVLRGLRIAAAAADDFRALLAVGLSLVIGVQAFIIAAGNLRLVPLTGITLPFISYGGSSLLANGLVVGLLLALSDRGPVLLAPSLGGRSRFERLLRRGVR